MINWWEIGKGVLCFLVVFIYFKYINFSEEKFWEKKLGDNYGDMYRLGHKMRDIGGWIVGGVMFIIGLIFIYNELARNYNWVLIMAKE